MALQKSTITAFGETFDYWTLKEAHVIKNEDDTFTYKVVLKLYKNRVNSKKGLQSFQRLAVEFINGSFGLNQAQLYAKIKENEFFIDATDVLE